MKSMESIGTKFFRALNYLIMLILIAVCVYPFYYVFIISISDSSSFGTVFLLPNSVDFTTYRVIFNDGGVWNALFISVARTVLGMLVTLFVCSLFGYLMSKQFFMKKVIYRFVIITMYFNAGLIPYYLTIKSYHLTDNFLVYIIPGALSAFNVILIKTFIEQIPPSLEESAFIDGAGLFQVFTRIIIPVSKPILATIAVFSAVGQWNSYMDNYLFVHNELLQTLQLKLYLLLTEAQSMAAKAARSDYTDMNAQLTPTTVRMTITVITTFPILLVYPFLQRFFVKGIMLGAVKG